MTTCGTETIINAILNLEKQMNELESEITQLVKQRDEAREAARYCYKDIFFLMWRSEALRQWPWLDMGGDIDEEIGQSCGFSKEAARE